MLIDYDRAAADYEASLVTKLRGHGAGSFLENWVPDPDPVLGIFNMIEAAWTGGRDSLELVVSRATLDASALERLKAFASAIAQIGVANAEHGHRLEVRRVARNSAKVRPPAPAVRAKAAAPHREQQPPRTQAAAVALHPALAVALDAETASFTHEGKAGERAAISLEVGADEVIRTARHGGVRPEVRRRLAELMCQEIEGRTVQDASDHAAVLVIHRLCQRAPARPAAGILLPANAGTEVLAALELVRNACRSRAGKGAKENFFELGPTAAWRAVALSDKRRRVAEAAAAFCAAQGAAPTAAKAVRIDKDIHGHEIRVIVQMDGTIQGDGVPLFLRRLERFLKGSVEEALQVYLEPLKDKSVLRRL